MSVVGVMNNGGPEGSGYVNVNGITNLPLIDSPEMCGGDRWFSVKEKLEEKEKNQCSKKKRPVMMSSSSSESSIGKNSDVTGELKEGESDETEEVQSPFKSPLDAMEALEDVLPMRRGISRFYNGKSKSFASLEDASSISSSSIKHITKPETPYSKRRRNLLASSTFFTCDKNNNNRSSRLTSINGGGISKRVACNHRPAGTLSFALSMSNNNNQGLFLSPLSRCKKLPAWRSFSFADLQQPAGSFPVPATSCTTNNNPTQSEKEALS